MFRMHLDGCPICALAPFFLNHALRDQFIRAITLLYVPIPRARALPAVFFVCCLRYRFS